MPCQFSVPIAGHREIDLRRERRKSLAEASSGIEEQPRFAMISIAEKRKQWGGELLPFATARFDLSRNARQQHSEILRAKAPPVLPLGQQALHFAYRRFWDFQIEFSSRPQGHTERVFRDGNRGELKCIFPEDPGQIDVIWHLGHSRHPE